ncbi:MAG: bL21 family ribosomal protein [Patescibacteria group bacterium]|jgi:large subunit ribosomal protein L21
MADMAVIKTGGKQYKVKVGDSLKIEKLSPETKKIEFDDILGGKKVAATLTSDGRFAKVRILKFRPKKRYKRVRGHVQKYSSIKIESIK